VNKKEHGPRWENAVFVVIIAVGIVLIWVGRSEEGYMQAVLLSLGANFSVVALLFVLFEAVFGRQPGQQQPDETYIHPKWKDQLAKEPILAPLYISESTPPLRGRSANIARRQRYTDEDLPEYDND
jgi:hypothetical protein